ncbi:hypothetical protein FRB95_006935 [Tulasnella sp. JGI-2019a]|nr:hypothetical protein FRB95_006935 [Tulasnella sp. JGI-2019a]
MSTVLIIGATGFIAGYIVYGLARTPEKARLLAQNEILTLQGDISNLSEWIPKSIETIIDISGLREEAYALLEQAKKIGAGRKPTDPKLGFIYTSGMWVHGTSSEHISEATILTRPSPVVGWRPEAEATILSAHDVLDVAVTRPSLLYSGNGTICDV